MKGPLRVPLSPIAEGLVTLPEEASRYVVSVHRRRAGDALLLFDGRAGVAADATIERVASGRATVRVGPPRAARRGARRAVVWIHGLPRGDKSDAITRDATELGATDIVFAPAERSVTRLAGERGAARLRRWEKVAAEAARQCGREEAPRIALAASWEGALGRAPEGVRVCLHPTAQARLGEVLRGASADEALVFAAGPEGGLSDDELRTAEAHGFRACAIDAPVLRTETVPAAVLGAVAVLLGAW